MTMWSGHPSPSSKNRKEDKLKRKIKIKWKWNNLESTTFSFDNLVNLSLDINTSCVLSKLD